MRITERTAHRRPILQMSNGSIEVDVMPAMGGRIWNIRDVVHDVQWVWHHPSVPPEPLPLHTSYDDHWAGGWEQLFPNDAPGRFEGRELPDHGEWWTREWRWAISESADSMSVVLSAAGAITKTALEKEIAIDRHSAAVRVTSRITNLDDTALSFLFKEHLPLAVSPSHLLELPGGVVTPVDLGFSRRIGAPGPFAWPKATGRSGEAVDLRTMPDSSAEAREFVYVRDLPEGWCGVTDTRNGRRVRMHYSRKTLPYVWFFMTFGGWRDIYTVVLEPCTNMPKDLSTAKSLGQCAGLAPGETFTSTVVVELS